MSFPIFVNSLATMLSCQRLMLWNLIVHIAQFSTPWLLQNDLCFFCAENNCRIDFHFLNFLPFNQKWVFYDSAKTKQIATTNFPFLVTSQPFFHPVRCVCVEIAYYTLLLFIYLFSFPRWKLLTDLWSVLIICRL